MNFPKFIRATFVSIVLVTICIWTNTTHGHEEHMQVANKQVTLSDVCTNRRVPIISVQEARRLINELKSNMDICPENYVQSFYELEPVLILNEDQQLCSEEKFNQIAQYHFRYVNPLQETYEFGDDLNNLNKKIVKKPLNEERFDETVQLDDFKQEILIPISLQQFFKSWALQVSGICKQTLVDNIEQAMQQFTDADMNLFDGEAFPATGDSATKINLPQNKQQKGQTFRGVQFGDLVYMPHLEGELKKGDIELRERTTVMDFRSDPNVNKFMHACKKRFQPIYSKLILPIERLCKLGYDYMGPHIDKIRDKLYHDKLVLKWMVVTAVCESQGNFELVESDDNLIGKNIQQLTYMPMYSYRIDNELWIKGSESLRTELARINGARAKGFKKFLFDAGVFGRKAVAKLDPHQFAWYRRNQNTASSVLNIISISSNMASILSSVYG